MMEPHLHRRDLLLLCGGESPAARAARYGLVAAWNLEEASGARADAFGTNHLTDNNTVTSNPGKVGLAGQFTAANAEYLSIADNAALSTGDVPFWLALWVYMDAIPAGTEQFGGQMHSAGSVSGYGFDVLVNRVCRFQVGTAGGFITVSNAVGQSIQTWHLLFGYHDPVAEEVGYSVDNSAFTTMSTAGSPAVNSSEAFMLGARSSLADRLFNGMLDAVAFGKNPVGGFAVTTPSEIRDYLFNSGAGRQWPWT